MTTQRTAWLTVAAALLTACSAAGDPDPFYEDDDRVGWGGAGAEGEPGEAEGPDTLGSGGAYAGGGFAGGEAGDPLPDTIVGTVCYPGPAGNDDACVPLVEWSGSWGSAYAYPSHSSPQYRKPLRFVDLAAADPDLGIANHFVLGEVMQQWKGRYGIFQPHVVDKIQQIRDRTGGPIYINSAYRSPGYNGSVDGATYSRHMFGDAVDMRSGVVGLSTLRSICEDLAAGYIGMYTTFIHCDWRNHPLEPKFFAPGTVSAVPDGASDVPVPQHTADLVLADDGLTFTAPATGFDEGEPLRTWTSYDSAGHVIEMVDVGEYQPPADAVRLHVEVGGNVELELEL